LVEAIPDMPAGTLGFHASGRLRRQDYQRVLLPPLHEAIERGDELRLLVHVGPELEGIEPSELWSDVKAEVDFGIVEQADLKRAAIVSDVTWVRRGMRMFGWMASGEVKLFKPEEGEAAREWVVG
jgi:hypothetical protein